MMVSSAIPPTTVVPIAFREAAPAPLAMTSGRQPTMNASEVITIGRIRSRAASIAACRTGMPRSTRTLANSTIRIAFFAAKPMSMTRPICMYTLFSRPRTAMNANAPKMVVGTVNRTASGTVQLSYSAARQRKANKIARAKMREVRPPESFSSRLMSVHS